MSRRLPIGPVTLLAAAAASAHAQSATPAAPDYSGVVLSLALVVGLILVGAFVLKRTPFGLVGRGDGPLRLVAQLPLGPKERLLLVAAHEREVLIAVSPAGIAILDAASPAGATAGAAVGASAPPAAATARSSAHAAGPAASPGRSPDAVPAARAARPLGMETGT